MAYIGPNKSALETDMELQKRPSIDDSHVRSDPNPKP